MNNKNPTLIERIDFKAKLYSRFVTSRLRTLPDFLIIGAAKTGTTSLYNYLIQHPQILPSFKKEVHFFDRHYQNGINWYKSFFPLKSEKENKNGKILMSGESSPYYLYHPLSAHRVHEHLPGIKLFVVLRNPIDRAVSNYNHRVRAGQENLSIEEAFAQESDRITGEGEKLASGEINFSFEHYYHSYLTRGIYACQLENWFKYFQRNQFLILDSEELYTRPESAYKKSLIHLHLLGNEKIEFKKFNSGGAFEYKNISPEQRERILLFFKPHNDKLFKLLGKEFDWNK